MAPAKSRGGEREALFVRIPTTAAERLDRAAFELKRSKQDIVSALVTRYVDPSSPAGLDALRALGAATPTPAPVTLPPTGSLALGHHDFRPDPAPDVLTLADAAALLQVEQEVVQQLAEAGELPGRRIGSEWRFTRQAILDWLSAASS